MAFIPTIPQAGDALSTSQGQLLANNAGLDTTFGLDHYTFSDATANNGFHKKVTSPDQVTAPVTTTNPAFYGLIPSQVGAGTPIGLIQFSRGPNAATPSPLTRIHGFIASLVAGSPQTMIDLTGLPRAIINVYAFSASATARLQRAVYWNGVTVIYGSIVSAIQLNLGATPGLSVQIDSTLGTQTNVYWTIELLRIS